MALENDGKVWSWEETILAFDLYSRMPYSSISGKNPEVIELANLLRRKPGAVAKKMFNIAAHDPAQLARGVVSLQHSNKFDRIIWEKFETDTSDLIEKAKSYKASITHTSVESVLDEENGSLEEIEMEIFPYGEDRLSAVRARVGQYYFRNAVLSSYDYKCCVTGISETKLLNASHIKPWKDSDPRNERTNPRNGLCLNALHDRAFDRGYITLNNNLEIIISDKLKRSEMDEKTINWFYSYEGKRIMTPSKFEPSLDFLEWHQDKVFLG